MKINLLILPDGWGVIADEQVAQATKNSQIFLCGKCSNKQANIYHNFIGQHRHYSDINSYVEYAVIHELLTDIDNYLSNEKQGCIVRDGIYHRRIKEVLKTDVKEQS